MKPNCLQRPLRAPWAPVPLAVPHSSVRCPLQRKLRLSASASATATGAHALLNVPLRAAVSENPCGQYEDSAAAVFHKPLLGFCFAALSDCGLVARDKYAQHTAGWYPLATAFQCSYCTS